MSHYSIKYQTVSSNLKMRGISVSENSIRALNNMASKKLASFRLLELPKLSRIEFNNIEKIKGFTFIIEIISEEERLRKYELPLNLHLIRYGNWNVRLILKLNSKKWRYPFSFEIYKHFFQQSIRQNVEYKDINFVTGEFLEQIPRFEYCIKHTFDNEILYKNLEEYINTLKSCHFKTLEVIDSSVNIGLMTQFCFPEELKTSCKQYLLYFAQFLQDLGINATSNLKEEAGKVLFSVTPTDDIGALDKIREALAVYLNLPSSPIVYNDSFAAMRLQAEIERLQSSQRIAEMEFRVAQKALESQDKIIHQQSVLLEQQAKAIEKITNPKVMIDSAEKKEELEKVYEGIEVGESETLQKWLGIKFNPIKTVKTAVKNTLGKGDEIIELGLDKNE